MRRGAQFLVVAALATGLFLAWAVIAHYAQLVFGFRSGDGNSPQYLFWSGAGSDLAYLSVGVGALTFYRKNNCRKHWCWRIGRHEFTDPSDGVSRLLCWRHHPDVKHNGLSMGTIEKIQHKRHLYFGEKPGKG